MSTGPDAVRQAVLQFGYGISPAALPAADLVISAGGETLPANVAAARILGAANIFIGSLRGMDGENFSLVVTSYACHAGRPRHLVSLKPSSLDPDELGRAKDRPGVEAGARPRLAGLLIGGDSGLFHYRDDEWHAVFSFARAASRALGLRWLVSTSRRTPPPIAEAAFELAKDKDVVADFLDYRLAGPGSLNRIFSRADVILCSEDSSTMISEAVWARLPVIGFSPANHAFKAEEAEYRAMMEAENWCRFIPIGELSVERFREALREVRPLAENPLDRLARELDKRLPELTGGGG
ncbi:MAG: hypothetical protein D6773_02605 [Alphaproteobacteria bacterium]|nr:MAG: hypothetical protein D6773_02605 [Alphaproteobacteria bacterium]